MREKLHAIESSHNEVKLDINIYRNNPTYSEIYDEPFSILTCNLLIV